MGYVDEVVRRARTCAPDSQPWPGQFLLRAVEMKALLSRIDPGQRAAILGMRLYHRLPKLDGAIGGSGAGPMLGQYACYLARPAS